MSAQSYLQWLVENTATSWWHDSADPDELRIGLEHGASGVTTNPLLVFQTLNNRPDYWSDKLGGLPANPAGGERAETLIKTVVSPAAHSLMQTYEKTNGRQGYVCAQINPATASDAERMLAMAHRFHAWERNMAVKLPATAAGLDALEECTAAGMTVTATVSFTVPQVIAVAERFRKGLERSRKNGKTPGQCFAVIMIGRLDDYLRDVVRDNGVKISDSDLNQAGIAVTKRAYSIYKERNYEAVLIIAALRGVHHMTALAGAGLIMSIHPKNQAFLLQPGVLRGKFMDEPVNKNTLERLMEIPEFVRAYEPEGMKPDEFIAYGLTQRTLSQFNEGGWSRLEVYQ